MIIERIVRDEADTKDLIEHRSDRGMKLRQVETGRVYGATVVDAIPCLYSYEETDEPEPVTTETVEDKAEGFDILTGVIE